jgi:ribonuclease D
MPEPTREEIALLPAFERLPIERITLVSSAHDAESAAAALRAAPAWGFDTESRPTFVAGEVSDGPHTVQFALLDHAWVFQLHDEGCRAVVASLFAEPGYVKAGFGLANDRQHIAAKFGVAPVGLLDLDTVLRQRGYRRHLGVKTAIAVLFGQRFVKSKRYSTSNWSSRTLSPAQLLYAANDAWAALRVWQALTESSAAAAPAHPG